MKPSLQCLQRLETTLEPADRPGRAGYQLGTCQNSVGALKLISFSIYVLFVIWLLFVLSGTYNRTEFEYWTVETFSNG